MAELEGTETKNLSTNKLIITNSYIAIKSGQYSYNITPSLINKLKHRVQTNVGERQMVIDENGLNFI